MRNYIFIITGISCLFFNEIEAQSSLKRSKQTNRFHYLQANLHSGYLSNLDRIDLSTSGPKNRLVYQYLAKNQRLLQKGYVEKIALSSFSARFSLDFVGSLQDKSSFSYQLKLQNLGASFATKWDRTSFFVGYSNIRLGHNPKIDPVTNFTANSLSLDLGYTQDFGISFKTALSEKYDFEVSIYSGGVFRNPLLSYTPGLSDDQKMDKNTIELNDISYNGSWIGTARIGTPLFRSLEYGVFAMAGEVGEVGEERFLTRIGVDVIKKVKELFKFESQVSGGLSYYEKRDNSTDIALQNSIEYYIKSIYIISTSNAVLFTIPQRDGTTSTKGALVNSFSYVLSPHTRIRLNHFYNYSNLRNENWGVTLQIVTGIGKR